MATYQILSWQDIPSQIKVWDEDDEIKVDLGPRFIARIDRAAQAKGLTEADAYLSQWQWSEEMEREGSAATAAEIIKKELEERFL